MSGQGSSGNVIAAICSFFIPGLGQLVQGRVVASIFFFVSCSTLYSLGTYLLLIFLYPVALLFHFFSIVNAAQFDG